jgi:membrane protein
MYAPSDWLGFIRYVSQRYRIDDCPRFAAALTYTSLFAVVPLMTVMYAALSLVPSMQTVGGEIENYIFQHFVPASGQEIHSYLQHFSAQARSLTGAGIALLAVTAILMLRNIENIFNRIWRTRDNRRGLASFLLYWALLSLGPIFLGLAFAITTYLLSLKVLTDSIDQLGLGQYVLVVAPYLLTAAAFTLIYAAVPNCRVPFRHALTGGLLTAFAFEQAKSLFAWLVANSSFEVIYGTFAAIPLFLLWIYLCWLIILAGAQLVAAMQAYHPQSGKQLDELSLALAVIKRLADAHRQGHAVNDRQLLAEPWLLNQQALPADRWPELRNRLLDAQLLAMNHQGHYLLGRDIYQLSLWQLIELLQLPAKLSTLGDGAPAWYQKTQQLLQQAEQSSANHLAVSLGELYREEI